MVQCVLQSEKYSIQILSNYLYTWNEYNLYADYISLKHRDPFCHPKKKSILHLPGSQIRIHSNICMWAWLSPESRFCKAKCFLCISLYPKLTTPSTSATVLSLTWWPFFHQVLLLHKSNFGCGRDEDNKVACSLHQPPRVCGSNSCLSKFTHFYISWNFQVTCEW